MTAPRPHFAAAFAGTLASTVVPTLAGIASSVTLARTLDPSSRGEMAMVLLWPLALGVLGDPGVSYALSFLVSRDKESASGLWTVGLVVGGIWGGILAVAGGLILATTLSLSPPAWIALRLALAGVPLTLITGYGCFLLLGGGRLGASNLVRGGGLVLYAAGVLSLAAAGKGRLLTYAAAWLLAQATAAAGAAVMVHRELGAGWQWRPDLFRPVFSYGARVYASALAAQTSLRLDQLLMSILGLATQLGFYVVAVAVASFTGPFFTALAILALHRVTTSPSSADAAAEIRRVLQVGLFLGVPLILVGVLAVWPLLPVIFGTPYTPARLPAQILLLASLFQGANAILGNCLRGLNLPGRPAAAEGAGSVVTIVLLVWLLPRYGAVGAAAVSLVAYAVVALLELRFLQREGGLRFRDQSVRDRAG